MATTSTAPMRRLGRVCHCWCCLGLALGARPARPGDFSRAPAGCERTFHGCLSPQRRNETLALAQLCVLQAYPAHTWRGRACAALLSPTPAASAPPGAPRAFCGFESAAAQAWLAALHRATSGCETVLFTVVTAGSDNLSPLLPEAGEGARGVCAIALLEPVNVPPADGRRALDAPPGSWFRFALPAAPIFPGPARVAHSFKATMLALFPNASRVLYADGKAKLNATISATLAQLTRLTKLPSVVLQHPWSLYPELEAEYNKVRVRFQKRPRWHEDLKDIDRARAAYAAEGHYNNQPGMIDAVVLAQQRNERGRPHSGLPLPSPPMLLRAFECVWFNEVAHFSMREQVSFFYAVDMLGFRRHVYVLPHRPIDKAKGRPSEAGLFGQKAHANTRGVTSVISNSTRRRRLGELLLRWARAASGAAATGSRGGGSG